MTMSSRDFLCWSHLVEKVAEGPGFAVLADPDDLTGQVIQDDRQVTVPLADGDLIDGQNAEPSEIRLAVLVFQKELVDIFDGFPVQTQMLGHFFHRHDSAQLVDILSQALRDPEVGMKKTQVLDEDSLTLKIKDLVILAIQPSPGRSQVQILHSSLRPAGDVPRMLPTDMADRMESLIGNYFDSSLSRLETNRLFDNSNSRKWEIFCYTQCEHRWPPLDNILAQTQVYYPSEIPDVHYCLKF